MMLSEFDFPLPEELIAQAPADRRDASRLLVAPRDGAPLQHRRFTELPELLREGDLLVLNDTRVIPARLLGAKAATGGRVELLLVRPSGGQDMARSLAGPPDAVEWTCLGQASKGL